MPCVVRQDGDIWTINERHAKYPHPRKNGAVQPPPEEPGPGTELKKLLSRIGIRAKPNCSCNRRAKVMNEKGVEWCRQNEDVIVGWLREEARKRGLPFIDAAGRMIVRMAVKRASR